MKSFITLAIVMLAVVLILQTEANPLDSDRLQVQGYGTLVRTRRATCDLFSALGVEDSLCAAHCLAMFKGFRGGHCDDGVCICRK